MKINIRNVAPLLLMLCCTFAASNSNAQDDQKVSLMLEAFSDSEGASGKHYKLYEYSDESCAKPKKGFKIGRKRYAEDTHQFQVVDIEVGKKFLFQVDYTEDRRRSTRMCSYMIGFTPQAGRSYKASYKVTGEVSRCRMTIADLSNEELQVEVEVPKHSCERPKKKGNKNGVPTHSAKERLD